jgi:hypothetical protein
MITRSCQQEGVHRQERRSEAGEAELAACPRVRAVRSCDLAKGGCVHDRVGEDAVGGDQWRAGGRGGGGRERG